MTHHYRSGSSTVTYKHNENPYDRLVVDYQVSAEVPDGTISGEGRVVLTVPIDTDGGWHMRAIEMTPDGARYMAQYLREAANSARVSQSETGTATD